MMRSIDFHVGFAGYPAEGLAGAAVGEDDAGIVLGDAGNQADRVGEIGDFRGHGEGRVHLDRHGEFASGPVEDDAALRREIEAALRLVVGTLPELAVAEDLEVDQAEADGNEPQAEKSGEGVEPEFRVVRRRGSPSLSSQFPVLSSRKAHESD